ncbi:DUF4954 family protein [Candidatus Latescibacterota bacterium]
MDSIKVLPAESIGSKFIPNDYLTTGKDEYHIRNKQIPWSPSRWRNLNSDEVERLVKNNNTAENWDELLVTDIFDPGQIKNSEFFGLVRIGSVRNVVLEHHSLKTPVGITNSLVISCDIGDDVAIHDVRYISHFIIGDQCILCNVDELNTTDYAKFGNGIIKEGEPESHRIWVEIMNETGSRRILPFDGIIPADAYLWAKYRDDKLMIKKLKEITQSGFDNQRGYYGTIGNQCVIKNSRILKDVCIGDHCYIKGANKLKNLTIHSSAAEPTQLGEGCELVNGIIGYGCHIFYGCKAVRFILGDNSNLKYGARLINSFLGDNSTISCCEVLNNLIFPAHEQHHNNSFLIASVVMGQSNMAAGVTIGSNHNSRANDNEIQAGRGFWPGLCTSVKHSCRFASFVLLSKSDYPAELDIPLPFSLLNNNTSKDRLEVIPAFWWLYNMYALARNSWKFQSRDKRKNKVQHIEFEALAPDTIEEMFNARTLIEIWTAKAYLRKQRNALTGKDSEDIRKIGAELLRRDRKQVDELYVTGENMEKSYRDVVLLKVYDGYHAYGDMIHYYAVKQIIAYMTTNRDATATSMSSSLYTARERKWTNLGGQLILSKDIDMLRADIGSGILSSWDNIHQRYDTFWEKYQLQKQNHAYASLCDLNSVEKLTREQLKKAMDKALNIQKYISDQVYLSRKKDYDNPFRQATYRNAAEMEAAIGTIDDNEFIKQIRTETEDFQRIVCEMQKRV